MNDRQGELFADFRLAGADLFNMLLIKHNVIGPPRQVKYALLWSWARHGRDLEAAAFAAPTAVMAG
jgi:hypothetical protein